MEGAVITFIDIYQALVMIDSPERGVENNLLENTTIDTKGSLFKESLSDKPYVKLPQGPFDCKDNPGVRKLEQFSTQNLKQYVSFGYLGLADIQTVHLA